MASPDVRITLAPNAPYSGISIPGADPSVTIMRGETVVTTPENAERLIAAADDERILDPFSAEHVTIEPVDGDDVDTEDKESADNELRATSAAEELADEFGLDLGEVAGTGKDGRIKKSDVEDYIDAETSSDNGEEDGESKDGEDSEEE